MTAWRTLLILILALGAGRAGAEGLAVGDWRVQGDTYQVAGVGRALYSLLDQPYILGQGTVEATVTVRKRVATGGWAAAGVMICSDWGNLWVLALVESPDGTRYTELMERCQEVHQAQSTGLTRLIPTEGCFGGAWEYNRPYRLRLALARNRITGDVTDAGTGQALSRHGWLLDDALAVRDGWATLRSEELDATLAGVKVTAPPPPSVGTSRRWPGGPRGCVGLYWPERPHGTVGPHWLDDLPAAEPRPNLSGLEAALKAAGFATAWLNSRDLWDQGALHFPELRFLAADLRRVPAAALQPLKRWMQQGGILVSLTAPAFGEFLWLGPTGWVGWDEYTQGKLQDIGRSSRPILTWSEAELTRWTQSLGGQATRQAALSVQGQAPDGSAAASFVVPHFPGGWWSASRDFDAPPARPSERLVCFWIKGDGKTPELSLELRERDGSRWVATFPLTDKWRLRVLPLEAFIYWPDNPSKGRGGPGDQVRLQDVTALQWGISNTHTVSVLMVDAAEHHIQVGAVGLGAGEPQALAGLAPPARPDLEGISPGYKLCEIKDAAHWLGTETGQSWGITIRWPWSAPAAYSPVERPQGEGFNRGHWWRWVPLIKATNAEGVDLLGAPLSVFLNESMPLPRCAWISVGALRGEDLERPQLQGAIAGAILRLSSGPLLFEGGTDRFLAYTDEPITVGARVVNYAATPAEADVRIQITSYESQRVVPQMYRSLPRVSVQPRGLVTAELQQPLPPLPAGDYTVVTTLRVGGRVTDEIRHPLTVKARIAEPPAGEIVRREGGALTLAGKPWHPVGANYWPHNLGGTPTEVYSTGWLDPVSYQPTVVEADLAQMERWGFHAIAAVGAEIHWGTGPDTPQLRDLLDFFWRCQRHHLKVILFVPGLDPRGWDETVARQVILAVRHHPALMGYDIAWEPWYGDGRRLYTPLWRDWLVQQYGSLEKAEAALGQSLPRDAAGLPRDAGGQVEAPSDDWLSRDGPWRALTAAYRVFMDYQIGVEYRRSAAFVRANDPWHLVGFRGSTPDWPQAFKPVEQLTVLHFMDWAGPEGYDVPVYGKVSPPGWISSRGLCTRWLSFVSGGKPVFWMEFGLPIYPNGTDWKDEMIRYTPAQYQYQCDEGRSFWQMQAESGAWGSFVWWYPGGFRVGENSDCGLVDPNNMPHPVAEVARQLLPGLAASETRKADTWLEFKPESNPGGWVGEYLRLRPEYERLWEQGKTVDVRTGGVGMTSADCPLLDPAGRPWPGAGPLRYLNAAFERLRIRPRGGAWQELALPTAPAQPVEVRLPAGQPVEVEAWAGNLAEATWLPGQVTLNLGTGLVRQVDLAPVGASAHLEARTPFQGSGHFLPTVALGSLTEARTLRPQVAVAGRAQGAALFGEVVEVKVVPDR